MAGNGCILSWPGDGGRHNTTSGAICSPQCYTRAEITAEQNRGIPSLCPASGPLMWSPLSLSRGQLYSPWCGDHPSIVTSWHSARGHQHYPMTGEGCSKHGRLKTEVWTNTTHNCLLRSVSVGNAGTDTREEFAKTALNLSIFSILSYECQKLLPPSLYCVLRINGSIAFLPVQSWLTFIICYCFPRYCYTSRTSGHKKWSGTFGPNYLLVESRAKNKWSSAAAFLSLGPVSGVELERWPKTKQNPSLNIYFCVVTIHESNV